jgi:hypothetical protein
MTLEKDSKVVLCVTAKDFPPEHRLFHDDVEGKCHTCKVDIIHRPHHPKDVLYMCMECVKMEMIDGGVPTVAVTDETLAEIKQLLTVMGLDPKGTKH